MSCKLKCSCSSKFKLVYFNGKGRAETIRLVFAAAGISYEDKRIEKQDWPTLKPNTPWGSLPILEADGKTIGQSMTIARFVAKETGLYGKGAVDQALVDSVVDAVTELREAFFSALMAKDEIEKEKLSTKLKEETLPSVLTNLSKFLGGKNFFVGDKLSIADLHFYAVLEAIVENNPKALGQHPKLEELYQRVAATPKVSEYLKKRAVTPF